MFSELKFSVIGSGRWGTAMAAYLAKLPMPVTLYCPDPAKLQAINSTRINPSLPNYILPDSLKATADLRQAVSNADVIVISTPVPHLRETLSKLVNLDVVQKSTVLLGINKGIEQGTMLVPPQIVSEHFPDNPSAQLGGPCFPPGLLNDGFPAAETLACDEVNLGLKLQQAMSSDWFRIYLSSDVYGVACMGALKNIYAIAAGLIEGLGLNEETMSIMITRALAELRRFCRAMAIPDETLFGLSGLGDLALTCYSHSNSRNKTFGKLFLQHLDAQKTIEAMGGGEVEGYFTTGASREICDRYRLDMPIVSTIHKILYEGFPPQKALSELMRRPLKFED